MNFKNYYIICFMLIATWKCDSQSFQLLNHVGPHSHLVSTFNPDNLKNLRDEGKVIDPPTGLQGSSNNTGMRHQVHCHQVRHCLPHLPSIYISPIKICDISFIEMCVHILCSHTPGLDHRKVPAHMSEARDHLPVSTHSLTLPCSCPHSGHTRDCSHHTEHDGI